MNLVPFEDKDGMRVWLDESEVELLLDQADDTEERLAFLFGVRCGLRRSEIVTVTAEDVVQTTAGPRVRVWESKGSTYRETPAPPEVFNLASAMGDIGGVDTLIDRSSRWVERRLRKRSEAIAEHTGEQAWTYVRPHDLRRTWATQMAAYDVDPLLVCDWGGWNDLETFLEHYRGTYSPSVQRRQLEQVPWMRLHKPQGMGDFTGEEPATRLLPST